MGLILGLPSNDLGKVFALAQTPVGNTSATNVTTLTATLGSAPASGDLVICCVHMAAGTTLAAITSTGATWNTATSGNIGSGSPKDAIFYSTTVTTAAITATWTGVATASMDVLHFTGNAASPLDQVNAATSAAAPGSITPTVDGDLVIASYQTNQNITGTPAGYTAQTAHTELSPSQGESAYLIQGAATATNPTWVSTATTFQVACVASFKHG